MYNITNRISALDLGDYEGSTPSEALESFARIAGYADYAAMNEVAPGDDDELIVKKID